MAVTVNLDRAVEMNILYPFGVDETITMTYSEGTLTSTYQIVIHDKADNLVQTITESDAQFGKSGAVLTWNINYESGGVLTGGRTYSYEIQDTTNDYRIFYGDLTLTKTL